MHKLIFFCFTLMFTLNLFSKVLAASVYPIYETEQVESRGDAADDPAIWVHPSDTKKSRIIGTDKKNGLIVYNLKGKILWRIKNEPHNNVDVTYNFPITQQKLTDLVVANSYKGDKNILNVFSISPADNTLHQVGSFKVSNRAYGVCFYKSLKLNKFYVVVTGKKGQNEQWELMVVDGRVKGKLARTIGLSSKTEGCVADSEYGNIYLSEEEVGLWKLAGDPPVNGSANNNNDIKLIHSIAANNDLSEDLEGVALYPNGKGKGYIILSVQSKDSYAIFEREGMERYLGSFQIERHGNIDRVSHTDGIAVTPVNLGPEFSQGLFVAQDDKNQQGAGRGKQNFKIVPFELITQKFNLLINGSFDPRKPNLYY